ncbi:MAG: site-2 protease family protein [Deltaproteobacteria bacterium]|nr:site-2 protease family protein [Deltaproteobacteria bacterium]
MARAPANARARSGPLIPLGRWAGIQVGADGTWLIVFLLVTLSLSQRFAGSHPGWSPVHYWILGIGTSALFFLSIILHEFGHSLTAIRLGVPVRSITLFIFGGVAALGGEPARPRDEFLIALAGPAVSLALGVIFWLVGLGLGQDTLLGETAHWLGVINLTLFAFNLIPGFPLDGGRVLRAALWAKKKSLARATTVAASIGSLVAYGFMAFGVLTALFGGNLFGGLWLAFIGWFLLSAARSSAVQTVAAEVLRRMRVADVMSPSCTTVPPWVSLQEVVEDGVLRRGQRCFMVVRDDAFVGMITLHQIREVPREDWGVTSAQGAMVKVADLVTVEPDTDVFTALRTMDEAGVSQVPVLQGGRMVGALSREHLLGVLRNQMEFHV